jgi:hypothetical protein
MDGDDDDETDKFKLDAAVVGRRGSSGTQDARRRGV